MNGVVKFWNTEKAFGFIEVDTDRDVFVHISALKDGLKGLEKGQEVSFDVEKTDRGEQARNVKVID